MPLKVTNITDTEIICGLWYFDKKTGAEIDEDLGWTSTLTGSFIVEAKTPNSEELHSQK